MLRAYIFKLLKGYKLYAQQKASSGPRGRRPMNRPMPTRVRMGLVMRKGMDFGSMGDVETALRMQGVSLAPISTGEGSLTVGGVTVMATATADDIASGRVKGLVVPGGADGETGAKNTRDLIELARKNGLPVIGFGDAVAMGADVSGQNVAGEGAIFSAKGATAIQDKAELAKLVGDIAA